MFGNNIQSDRKNGNNIVFHIHIVTTAFPSKKAGEFCNILQQINAETTKIHKVEEFITRKKNQPRKTQNETIIFNNKSV